MTHHDPMAELDDDTQSTILQALARAAQAATRAQDRLREVASQARMAGIPITQIADTAGVTRQTVYRWTQQVDGIADGQAVDVRATLDRGLEILAAHGAPQAERYIGGAGTITGALAAWKTGVKNLPLLQLEEDEQATLRQVSTVVGLAKQHHSRTGVWPRTVTL